jgi:hypothetical protein
MKTIYKILTAFVIGTIPLAAFPQFNQSREITKRYRILPDTRVEITNKYGNILINNWDKDSVVFNIKINVEEKKSSKLEKTMDGIDFDFTNSPHFLVARTIVNKTSSAFGKELLKFKESLLQDEGNVEIDYTVWLPESCGLSLEDKFGNIFINSISGNCDITLSNGNLKAYEFRGKTTLNLNFADAVITKMDTGNLNISYSDLDIKSANKLVIDSKQSNYDLAEATELHIQSRGDKFRIRKADLVDAQGSFTNFRISALTDRINLRCDYGDLDINSINPEFSQVFVESKSTDINLYFKRESNFNFDITKTKTNTDFCKEAVVRETKVLDEKTQKTRLTGEFGKKHADADKLFINATSGSINIFAN